MRSPLLAVLLALAAVPSTRAADAGAEAARSYRIETEGTTREVAGGASGKVAIAIVPLPGTHVHPQAPLKIALEATPGLSLAKTVLGHRDALDPRAEGPRFEVSFGAIARGKQEVRARLDFFICSDQWCVKQLRDVAVPIDVL